MRAESPDNYNKKDHLIFLHNEMHLEYLEYICSFRKQAIKQFTRASLETLSIRLKRILISRVCIGPRVLNLSRLDVLVSLLRVDNVEVRLTVGGHAARVLRQKILMAETFIGAPWVLVRDVFC
jgi:hypothetical protein